MTIGAIGSHNWNTPLNPNGTSSSASGSTSGVSADMFEQLAADIQAVLVQGQTSSAAPAAAGTNTATATTPADPAQQLAADLQSVYAQLQGNTADAAAPSPVEANNQATPANQAQPQHHHHHHHMESDTATAGSTSTSAPDNIQGVSQALSAAILQVLQAYGNSTSASTSFGLTALA